MQWRASIKPRRGTDAPLLSRLRSQIHQRTTLPGRFGWRSPLGHQQSEDRTPNWPFQKPKRPHGSKAARSSRNGTTGSVFGHPLVWMDEIHFAPLKKPWETAVCGYLQGIRPFQGFLGGAGFRPSTASHQRIRCKLEGANRQTWSTVSLAHVGSKSFLPCVW